MSSHKRPWYKWYPRDFIAKPEVMALSCLAELVYRRILDAIAQTQTQSLPNNEDVLFKLIGHTIPKGGFKKALKELFYPGFEVLQINNKSNTIYSNVFNELADVKLLISKKLGGEAWMMIRERVFYEDDYTCQYCGKKAPVLECDHIIPRSRGGSDYPKNLITACFSCNRKKRDKTLTEWLGTVGA